MSAPTVPTAEHLHHESAKLNVLSKAHIKLFYNLIKKKKVKYLADKKKGVTYFVNKVKLYTF